MNLKALKTLVTGALMIATMSSLVGCGGGGGSSSSTFGAYSSPFVSADQFVDGLNVADNNSILDDSFVVYYEDETLRSLVPGEEDWFVIYDGEYNEYKAVSLQYVRAIIYYDYYANSVALADEFRAIETDDIFNGDVNGDFFGDNYEVLDYVGLGVYQGRNSGFLYEDEEGTTDVNLMAAEKEKMEFFTKASKISMTYQVSVNTAMSLVSLGKKVESAMKKGKSEILPEDQKALTADIERLTGKTFKDVLAASTDSKKKAELLKDVAKKIGTTTGNLENRLLPEVFGVKF
ncbi:MAG: hypothetical protein HN509_08935 [Halobacteriovoraceae bacterium]|nr:hypothetical protein [Halobacteriovoraceae bacterium]MBT5095937.1 hypothetical protein [Halobacteriovoraceae bacterium]